MQILLCSVAAAVFAGLVEIDLFAAESSGREKLIAALESSDPAAQLQAAKALGELGSEAEPAVPVLLGLMEQNSYTDEGESVGAAACAALGQIGRVAVPKLIEALEHEHPQVRRGAALALHDIGRDAAPAVPALIEVLKRDDPATNHPAIYALGAVGPEAKPAMPLLIEMLRHENQQNRWEACRALGAIGPEAKGAVPELLRLLGEGVASSRQNAAAALGRIGPVIGEQGINGLIGALDDRQGAVREAAAIALGRLGPPAKAAAPALEKALQRAEFEAKVPIAKAIWQITGDADRIVPLLARELETIEAGLSAAEALGEMGPAARAAVPQLIRALEHRDYETRAAVAHALGRIGPEARPAIPALRKRLEDNEAEVRDAAREALRALEKPDRPH